VSFPLATRICGACGDNFRLYRLVRFSAENIKPLFGAEGSSRRLNRVFPENRRANRVAEILTRVEAVTTARTTQARRATREQAASGNRQHDETDQSAPTTTSTGGVVRQWVSELTGAATPQPSSEGIVRAPREEEIETLTAMFPDVEREVILGVLQRRSVFSTEQETRTLTILAAVPTLRRRPKRY
jgi:hypothetical protein